MQCRARSIESSREPERDGTSEPEQETTSAPVSGRKLGTEERDKLKPNKQREPLQKGPVQQIKIPVGNTDYTGRGL